MDIINFISQAWPWYVSGPLIALVMFMLLWVGGGFGVSSTLRSACAIAGAGSHSEFFRFDWKAERWNLVFALGAIIGCLLYTSPSPRDRTRSRMPSSA